MYFSKFLEKKNVRPKTITGVKRYITPEFESGITTGLVFIADVSQPP